jgi:glucose-6-phosphate isomerase
MEVEAGTTTGDYLNGFFMGTRQALFESGRPSMTITIDKVNPFAIGVLIALFERTVGLYASLVDINAYHQPGVEAGKKAAAAVLKLQAAIKAKVKSEKGRPLTAEQLAGEVGSGADPEEIFLICEHLASNGEGGILRERKTPLWWGWAGPTATSRPSCSPVASCRRPGRPWSSTRAISRPWWTRD